MSRAGRAAAVAVLSAALLAPSLPRAEGPDGPLRIVRHGPVGRADGQVQVRVEFDRPVVPLAALDDPRRQEVLSRFRIEPPVEGAFRLLGTAAVVFEPAASLPLAGRYTVTVSGGITAVDGTVMGRPFSWTFTTPAINLWFSPADGAGHVEPEADITVTANVPLDAESLRRNLSLRPEGRGPELSYSLVEDGNNPPAEETLGMHREAWVYHLRPEEALRRDTAYRLAVSPGVAPLRGNLPTEREYLSRFRTYPPFRYAGSGFCSGCGPFLRTRPYLNFSNAPDWESFSDRVTLDPPAKKRPFRSWGCDGLPFALSLDDRLLEPRTAYTVTLPAGLRDIYGQEIENPGKVSFVTGPLTPRLYGPSGYQVISPRLPPEFALRSAEVPAVTARIVPLERGDILVRELLSQRGMVEKLLARIPGERLERTITLGPDGTGREAFDLRPYLGRGGLGAVAYSFVSPGVPCFDKPLGLDGVLLRTDLGIYSQILPTGARIKVNSLTDGSPVGGVSVSLYRSDELPRLEQVWDRITGEDRGAPAPPCAGGVTGEDGLLRLSAGAMKACGKRKVSPKVLNELYPPEADPDDILYDQESFGFAEPPELVIVAARDGDWTFLQTPKYGVPSVWQFGVMPAWEGERPVPRGTMFSDRNIYRPGETVQMKGVSRYLLYGHMHSGKGSAYRVSVIDPRGKEEALTEVMVSDFGTFSFEVPTRPGQPLGTYRVKAQGSHGDLRFWGSFRLAEFRAPEFVVSLETNRKVAVAGETARIAWEGSYYFGSPMRDAPSTLNLVREAAVWVPEGWERFGFGIPWHLEDRQARLGGQVSSEKVSLDGEGKASRELTVSQQELPRPMTYRAFAEIEDVTGQTAAAAGSVVFLPDRRLPGLRLDRWIVRKGEEVRAEVVAVDPAGNVLEGLPLTVRLLRREWHSIQRENHDGRVVTEREQVVTEVQSRKAVSGPEPVSVPLSPPAAGSYMVRVDLSDSPGGGTAAASALWAAGEEYVPWEDTGEDRLEIVFDREEYAVGDEAVALIRSPFRKADLYLTLCRERIFSEDLVALEGSAFTYRFTVTEEMLPNAFLGAFLVNRGGPLLPVEQETGRHMEKIGFSPFRVEKKSRYLEVAVTADRAAYRPAEEVEVKVSVRDRNGDGRRSELTVMVVDESVLALTGYRPPDLVKVVYADRGLSVRVADNRPFLIRKADLLQKGQGYGGGLEEGARVRRRFLRLAHYEPSLVTDDRGEATIRFTLPDNLTTFRIMAVAVGEENLFGYGDGEVTVTQPFVLRASLPRYTRVGDTFLGGVALSNLSGAPGRADVKVEVLAGEDSLLLEGSDPRVAEAKGLSVAAGESLPVLFAFRSPGAGRGRVRFSASFEGGYGGRAVREEDALEATHTVRDLPPTETVVAVGDTADSAVQVVGVDGAVRTDTGGLRLALSSSALAGLGESASYLVLYPYGCLEQTVSRLLALMEIRHLADRYGFRLQSAKPVDDVLEANFRKVLAMQNWDGGFKFWPTAERSTCWLSPYVARLFARRLELGKAVPDDALDGLRKYLHEVLRNPCTSLPTWRSRAEYRIMVLSGLSWLGEPEQSWFEEFTSRRKELSYGARIALARLLHRTPGWEETAEEMAGEILNGLFLTARTAHFEEPRELPPSWTFLSSPVITTSEGLALLLETDPDNGLTARMARYLLDARVNGRWRNTYENAAALDALLEFSRRREETAPDFFAQVSLAGRAVMEEVFRGHGADVREQEIPAADLPPGESDIALVKEGVGRLFYTLAYRYRLPGPQPARRQGFAVKRTVREWESGRVVAVFDTEAPGRASLEAGVIYQVELEFTVPQTGFHFVLDDSLPAGLEAIDTSLKTTSARYREGEGTEDTRRGDQAWGYWWNPFNHRELRDDGAGLFADAIRPGVYRFRYLARAATAGLYLWPGARASLMYEPEQFGTSAEGEVEVLER